MLYCHCEYISTIKAQRLQIRVGPTDKALLKRVNVSAFVVQAAAAKAEEILAERSSIRLSREAALAFSEALDLRRHHREQFDSGEPVLDEGQARLPVGRNAIATKPWRFATS